MIKARYFTYRKRGFLLLEVLLAVAIFAVIVIGGGVYYFQAMEATNFSGERSAAIALADEGLEVARHLAWANFDGLIAGPHGVATSSGSWAFSGTQDVIGSSTRVVLLTALDSNTMRADVTVTYQAGRRGYASTTISEIFTNWRKTVGKPIGNWSVPSIQGTGDMVGNNDGYDVAGQNGLAYIVRNTTAAANFAIYDATTTGNPALLGSLTLPASPIDIDVSGNYAYVAANNNNQGLFIVDISIPSAPVLVKTLALTGNKPGKAVVVSGNYAYVTMNAAGNATQFAIIGITDPPNASILGTAILGGVGNEVAVLNNYAYIASQLTNKELIVVDVTNPAAPTLGTTINLPNKNPAITIDVCQHSTQGYVLAVASAGNVFIYGLSDPAIPNYLGIFGFGNSVTDLSCHNNNDLIFIGGTYTAREFAVVSSTNAAAPIEIGSLNLPASNSGVFYDTFIDRTYLANASNTAELIVVKPQ